MNPSFPDPVLNRRDFVKGLSAAGLGLALGASVHGAATASPAKRKRYALVGLGSRHRIYHDSIEKDYKAHAELVAICDTNPGRLETARKRSEKNGAPPPPAYLAKDFDRLVAETKPEVVIITCIDAFHDDYIVRAMELGCDVISEKPMTTTAEKVQRIFDAKQRTGRECRVIFNLRYSPPVVQVKDILMSGEIGDILSVDMHWLLDTFHGASYFRRWNSVKALGGGLMITKATHHFDLVNWWLGAVPEAVYATGKRDFYTPKMAKRLGLAGPHERCLTCPEKAKCNFYHDATADKEMKELFIDNEKYDGYIIDRCIWRPDIDIEDTMNVNVRYDTGATLSYSLNAFNAWEGYMISFNGTKGRLDHSNIQAIYTPGANGAKGAVKQGAITTRITPLRGVTRDVEVATSAGSHGGGDKLMFDEIFLPDGRAKPDKYLRAADERAGAASVLVGVSANRCFQTGQPVKISDLVHGMKHPDYAPMPTHEQPVPMPPRV